jgi:hypothetical protein
MHQCQLTGSQSDWVKLRVLAETPMDSRSMKRKQHSMSDPVGTGGTQSDWVPRPTGTQLTSRDWDWCISMCAYVYIVIIL